eukprot:1176992-Prorocentrum_minimum.AAC.4
MPYDVNTCWCMSDVPSLPRHVNVKPGKHHPMRGEESIRQQVCESAVLNVDQYEFSTFGPDAHYARPLNKTTTNRNLMNAESF